MSAEEKIMTSRFADEDQQRQSFQEFTRLKADLKSAIAVAESIQTELNAMNTRLVQSNSGTDSKEGNENENGDAESYPKSAKRAKPATNRAIDLTSPTSPTSDEERPAADLASDASASEIAI